MVPKQIRLKTGDIIVTETNLPAIEHFGVVIIEDTLICIFHCTPFRDVACDTLSSFLEDREFKFVRHTGATREGIYEKYKLAKGRKYDVVKFNCIHFAEFLTG